MGSTSVRLFLLRHNNENKTSNYGIMELSTISLTSVTEKVRREHGPELGENGNSRKNVSTLEDFSSLRIRTSVQVLTSGP